MGVRRFKTSLITQRKEYGFLSARTNIIPSVSGGTISESGGYRIHTFLYTGSNQTLTVSSSGLLEVFLWGAAGGGSNAEGYSDPGGPGGFAYGSLPIQGGLNGVIQVGQGGGRSGNTTRPNRAYPSGGRPSIRNNYVSGGGGGRTAIFDSSVSVQNALIIAGGGGGASGHGGGAPWAARGCTGGSGGGVTGQFGRNPYDGAETQNQGTQSAVGLFSTSPNVGTNPAQLQGGDAGNGTAFSAGWNAAGGGGDGWYGGGAVNALHQGGGGGSGYLSNSIIGGSLESTILNDSRYASAINPPQTGNSYYITGVGRGNVNGNGGNGLLVLRYSLSEGFTYD